MHRNLISRSPARDRRGLGAGLLIAAAAGCAGGGPLDPPGDLDALPSDPQPPDAAARDDAGAADAAPPSMCSAGGWAPGSTTTVHLVHDGIDRAYLVHVGASVVATAPTPLLFNFHGLTSNAAQQRFYTGTDALADDHGFAVVYPEGIGASFNALGCCGTAAEQGIDDIGFARAIIEDVAANLCLDRKRVYATGMSNGGFMSYRLACSASDVFAAVAPVAGALASQDCQPGRPVPLIAFHGEADSIVSYASDRASIATFASLNGCVGEPERTLHGNVSCDRRSGCTDAAAVELCSYPDLGHAWPMSWNGYAATTALWTFLEQHSLP